MVRPIFLVRFKIKGMPEWYPSDSIFVRADSREHAQRRFDENMDLRYFIRLSVSAAMPRNHVYDETDIVI